jgi:DNA-binding CsgD family transcriptional regulator
MTENQNISKVMSVWESDNKILKPVKKELYLEIIEQMANLFSVGSFYYFVLDFENLETNIVSESIKPILGIEPGKYTVRTILDIVHPEDIEKMHEKEKAAGDFLFNQIPKEHIPFYKVVYLIRLKHTDGTYKTILHQSKAILMSDDGKIQKVLVIHTDVTYLNMPIDQRISFVSNTLPSFHSLRVGEGVNQFQNNCSELLTSREKEIIKLLSLGKNFNEMASVLCLSPHTINTHKRNILKKTNSRNTTELVARCIREGAI